ncbi:hypothetical protein FRUB_03577 [Fimbriiglobus ruber]|uniref:Uncharacterized protein n=1 Tax=Fimbriiglobus ruber TaxID=1908690 RepID=A0A225DZM2_9BACT|nr:hypothetical protein FRUB_03577 [Fimbriiglobus ruber]
MRNELCHTSSYPCRIKNARPNEQAADSAFAHCFTAPRPESKTVASSAPIAQIFPSGEKAKEVGEALSPRNSATDLPVSLLYSRMTPWVDGRGPSGFRSWVQVCLPDRTPAPGSCISSSHIVAHGQNCEEHPEFTNVISTFSGLTDGAKFVMGPHRTCSLTGSRRTVTGFWWRPAAAVRRSC